MDTKQTYEESLRLRLEQYLATKPWTREEAARKFHLTSATRLTKYVNLHKRPDRAEPDTAEVEAAIKNYFRHLDQQAVVSGNLFVTSVSKQIEGILLQIKETGDIGVIHSEGGVGKTSGLHLFRRKHLNTLFIPVVNSNRTEQGLTRSVFDEVDGWQRAQDLKPWDGSKNRNHWLEAVLLGADRLLILDDAHDLSFGGLKWAIKLHNATGLPLALVGNPSIIQLAGRVSQLSTRIGICRSVELFKDSAKVAAEMIRQYAPESGDDLEVESIATLERIGSCRALMKQLKLTCRLMQGGTEGTKFESWSQAFLAAGKQLIKPARANAAH